MKVHSISESSFNIQIFIENRLRVVNNLKQTTESLLQETTEERCKRFSKFHSDKSDKTIFLCIIEMTEMSLMLQNLLMKLTS